MSQMLHYGTRETDRKGDFFTVEWKKVLLQLAARVSDRYPEACRELTAAINLSDGGRVDNGTVIIPPQLKMTLLKKLIPVAQKQLRGGLVDPRLGCALENLRGRLSGESQGKIVRLLGFFKGAFL